MSENLRLYRKMCFLNTFYINCINVIIDSIGPSIILRSIFGGKTILTPIKGHTFAKMTSNNPNLDLGNINA